VLSAVLIHVFDDIVQCTNCTDSNIPTVYIPPDSLSVYVLYPTSLAKPHAVQQLAIDLKQLNIDVAYIVESWLNFNITDSAIQIDGYNLVRLDRNSVNKSARKLRDGGVNFVLLLKLVLTLLFLSHVAPLRVKLLKFFGLSVLNAKLFIVLLVAIILLSFYMQVVFISVR